MKPMSIYARVSKVGERDVDSKSYITEKVQVEKCRGWLELHGIPVSEIVVERDVSARKKDRELERLLRQVEAGETQGIVCYKLSRFGRSTQENVQAVERLTNAGGRLVCFTDPSVDTADKYGRLLVVPIFSALAELEWEARREGWDTSVADAIDRGLHLAGKPPLGYVRPVVGERKNGQPEYGPLEVDAEVAPIVVEAFRKRAGGESWQSIGRWMTEKGHPLTTAGVQSMIGSRTYLGEVYRRERRRNGDGKMEKVERHRKIGAHPAILTETEWQAAQWKGRRPAATGAASSRGFLSGGLAFCSSCERPMGINTGRRDAKYDTASYICKNQHRAERCTVPATAAVAKVDDYVAKLLVERLGQDEDHAALEAEIAKAEVALEEAEREMDAFLEHASAAALGDRYGAEVDKRREAIREAWTVLEALRGRAQDSLHSGEFAENWSELEITRQRAIARSYIERVDIERSTRGRWQPIEERVEVVWR